MLMSGKQFKILNRKLNTILQSQADSGVKHSLSSMEVDAMIKAAERGLLEKIDGNDKNNELRLKAQGKNFYGALQELKNVTKERHVLFVQEVKKVREDVNLKVEELKQEIAKELQHITSQNLIVQQRVDIVADAHC